ncbi:protein NEDD1 isoform X4 [Gambusia affinis]|uniref:protein NEDD1 isoform X4 n=1 Tax=Gambusia affinis TaxID=33528 RepID=UPI001CDCC036|nr:protein NEDD1 isoform X4 [Gambusia affinis]
MEEVMRLVSTGDCVKVWDAVSMATLEQFNPHSGSHPVAQACWSSNNQYLVSASSSGDKLVVSSLKSAPVPVVELADGKKQTRVCLSSSSQFLISGGLDHCVHMWDLKTKRLHRSLKDHKEEVTCVSFNANDSCIVSGSTSGDLVLHSLTTNLSSRAFGHGSNQPIHDLRLSTVKRSLLGSVSDGGTMVLWDANTQKELQVFDGAHKAPGSGLAFSPTSDLLVVSVGLDKKIICYDTASKLILRAIRVDGPLTSVDFTLDGTGLVVGSTQGKIYQYDLRNSSSPTRITVAHKTSVTCLRFQSNASRHKSSKLGSAKISNSKRSSSKLGSQSDHAPSTGPAPQRQVTCTGPDPAAPGVGGDAAFGRSQVTGLEGEGQELVGRASLDIFSPVKEDSHSGGGSQRRTPLGTHRGPAGGRSYSPLSVFQSPQTIKEEEPTNAAAIEPSDRKPERSSSSSQEGEPQTPPTTTQQTNQSQAPPPIFTTEPSLHRTNGIQTQLSYDSPAAAAASGSAAMAAACSSLSQNIADVVGQDGAAPLTSLQIHFIQNMIHETLEEFRTACHKDILNLQVEMIRQFYIQLTEIHGLIEKYSVNESLVEEIERLREENRRLKANY